MNHLRILKIITFMFLKRVASSIVNSIQVWSVTQNNENAYDVLFLVGQQISKGENKNISLPPILLTIM